MSENKTDEQKTAVILKNWETFKAQAMKLTDKSDKIATFLEVIEEELLVTPASTRKDLVCSYPGGLLEHSLRVLMLMAKLRKVYEQEAIIPANSLILAALFHDRGKIGIETKSYYVDVTEDWKRNKGQNYDINEKLFHIPVSQLSLRWLANYSFKLDVDEWYAISSVRDNVAGKDDVPSFKNEPMLSVILHQAIKVAILQGKNKKETTVIAK